MIINVATLTGKKMTFEINGSHKLRDLQLAVQDAEGIVPDQQRYIFAGVHLLHGLLVDQIEEIRLQNAQIRASSSIDLWLIVRLRGGGNLIYHRSRRSDSLSDHQSSEDEAAKDPENQIRLISVVSLNPKSDGGDGNGQSQVGDQTVQIPCKSVVIPPYLSSDSEYPSSDSESDDNIGGGRPPWGEQKEPFKLSGRRLQISIKSLARHEIPVEIAPTDTVDDIKQKIFEKEKIFPDDQRLVFGNLLMADGIVFNRVIAILDQQPQLANSVESESAPGGPDAGTVHVTIMMVQRLRRGANLVSHKVQTQSSPFDSDCDWDGNTVSDEVQGQRSRPSKPCSSNVSKNLKFETSSKQLVLVQGHSETSFSRERLKRFGFDSKTTHPLKGLKITKKSDETNGGDIGKAKLAVEGYRSQVLFEIPHSVCEKIRSKETNALHLEGIDQIIQGMYSLDLFRSRTIAESERCVEVLTEQILELNKKISEMEAELANQKALAKDAEDQSYNRGYESACRDIEECIANEHPEWDLSFIQS